MAGAFGSLIVLCTSAWAALGQDSVTAESALTSTTTTAVDCSAFTCPSGQILKTDAWSVIGSDAGACCEAAGENEVSLMVQSAGWNDGNFVRFYVNGLRLRSNFVRTGLNIVLLRSDATASQTATFNTHGDGSDALAAFLNGLDEGQMIMMAAVDEAAGNLTAVARAAIKQFGAGLIDDLGYRGSYALIGAKGAEVAMAERTFSRGEGAAVAIAHYEVASERELLPLCDKDARVPPVEGYISNGNLRLDAECRYELWPQASAGFCLKGTWAVVAGGSNTVLMSMGLANLLSPEAVHPITDHASMGSTTVVDVIIEDGVVTYKNSSKLPGCTNLGYDAACQELIRQHIAQAPAYSSSATRVTQFIAQYWDHVGPAIDIVQADEGWSPSKVVFLTQVSAWYIYCSVKEVAWCPRTELLSQLDADGLAVFQSDMDPILARLDAFCGESRVRSCMVGTTSWQAPPPGRQTLWYGEYNNAIMETTLASSNLRLLDLWKLGLSMPDECIGGHGSPVANLWIWQIVLGGVCDSAQAAEGAFPEFQGDLCFGAVLTPALDGCPFYREECPNTYRCEMWECANSMPCTLVANGEGDEEVRLEGMCNDQVQVNFTQATEMHGDEPCHHIWCDDNFNPWVLTVIAVGLCGLVFGGMEVWARLLPNRLRQQAAAKAKPQPAASSPVDAAAAVPDQAAPPAPALGNDATVTADKQPKHSISLPLDTQQTQAVDKTAHMSPRTPLRAAVTVAVEMPADEANTKGESGVVKGAASGKSNPDVVEKTAAKKANAGAAKAGDKFPLGCARFLASLHVVVGHLYARGVTAPVYFYGWGFTWVPWFFMLSGFVLFTAHLRRPKNESVIDYVLRRSVTIYPLYAVSLLPAFAIQKSLGHTPSIWALISQSFLTQAWVPWLTESALQSHCWFLSCMVVYWLCFKPLAYCLKDLSLRGTVSLMVALFMLPWLTLLIPAFAQGSFTWYRQHSWGATDTWLDIAVVVLKFNPICYAHVFVLGMLLAKLRLLLDARACAAGLSRGWRWPMEFVMPLGYLGLALVFFSPHMGDGWGWPASWGYKLSARLSVLLPFQAAILLGLAGLPSMPLPRLAFAMSQLNFLENYSYAVYVFQFICHSVWPQTGQVNLVAFLIFTVACAVIVAHTVQRPVQKWWGDHPKARIGVPFVLAALLTSLSFIPNPGSHTAAADLPDFVRLDSRTIDVRLPVTDPDSPGTALMNPSLLVQDGTVSVAARRHSREFVRSNGIYNGNPVTILDEIWHSDIVLGTADADAEAWADWPATGVAPFRMDLHRWDGLRDAAGERWGELGDRLCVRQVFVPGNNTLIRHIVTGPEDAKVLAYNDSTIITFDSLPPLGEDGCAVGEEVSQMYLATDVVPEALSQEALGYHLDFGSNHTAEKNWIPFAYDDQLHYVYQPVPHTVVKCQGDGACTLVGRPQTFRPLQRMAAEGYELRGSGQAVLIDDPEATPNLPQRHYLALLHVVRSSQPNGEYVHLAYRFSPEPPFAILQVSSQLELLSAQADAHSAPFAFVSGLAVQNRTVAITYGAGDRDARALVLTLDRLDEMFACDSAVGGAEGSNGTAEVNA